MGLLVLSVIGFTIIFIYFLVIVRTTGSIINYLTKVEYWLSRELEFKKEQEEVKHALAAEEAEQSKSKEEQDKSGSALFNIPVPDAVKPKKEPRKA